MPESGKTTVFNALTRGHAAVHAYGAHVDEVNLGSVIVPDSRYDYLVARYAPKRQVPATIDVTDGGARVEKHERGTKFGTDFLAGVRAMDALVLVLRGFRSDVLPPPSGGIDLVRDARLIQEELLLADLVVVENRLERLEKNRTSRRQSVTEAFEHDVLLRIHAELEAMRPVRTINLSDDESRVLRPFAFVSAKPSVVVANIDEADIATPRQATAAIAAYCAAARLPLITMCADVEMEISQMDPGEEREYLEAMGIEEPARSKLVRTAYEALGYLTFLTGSSDEVRAWSVVRGTTALGCAEKVHTDIARTFIRAEVVTFDDTRAAGGFDEAKAAGRMRLEGKDYVVQDGDVIYIRHSRG